MACNYFGKNYIWVGVSQEKKKGPVLKSLVAKGDKIEFGYCYATATSYSVIMSMYPLLWDGSNVFRGTGFSSLYVYFWFLMPWISNDVKRLFSLSYVFS